MLFTRDLRVHDQPALAEAARRFERVVPLFVFDDEVLGRFGAPNRVAFLLEALRDLRDGLARLGAPLVVRSGDVVAETASVVEAVRARAVYVSDDVSSYATRRRRLLADACVRGGAELHVRPGVTIVPPGALRPAGGDHYRVFTPYWRRWLAAPRRDVVEPVPIRAACDLGQGTLPRLERTNASPDRARGGELAGRARLKRWVATSRSGIGQKRHQLESSSRLSPYLHFGCVSPQEVEDAVSAMPGADAFRRQLCWRDFYHQLLAANPALARRDYRPRGDRWNDDPDAFDAWRQGMTGFPFVDAGMRQLAREGWIHNRVRLVTASFLVKDLYVDWRLGAEHFFELLVDGDLANNAGNWQWVAGTGTDPRPNRVFNPVAQGRRLDPRGEFVRRHVPELRDLPGAAVHEPWKLDERVRAQFDYPPPIVDHHEAVGRWRALRTTSRRSRPP